MKYVRLRKRFYKKVYIVVLFSEVPTSVNFQNITCICYNQNWWKSVPDLKKRIVGQNTYLHEMNTAYINLKIPLS
jgi:hypothetical protein